mmetsp:Transcript_52121/g.137896  ORF Transcript_52121/g.137896 Transcript_52121/m.137896 type:complete len:409 (-) Transcript_52121:15-1241(-)
MLRLMRIARLARLARLLRLFRELYLVVTTLAACLRALAWVGVLLATLTYGFGIFLVIALEDWDDSFDDGHPFAVLVKSTYFGNVLLPTYETTREVCAGDPVFNETLQELVVPCTTLVTPAKGAAVFTLFQIITLDGWSDIVRPLMHREPWLLPFILFFLVFGAYGVMNIVVGVVVSNTLEQSQQRQQSQQQVMLNKQRVVLTALKDFFMACDFDGSGTLDLEELKSAFDNPVIARAFRQLDIPASDVEELFRALDVDDSGDITFDEFINGCMRLKSPPDRKDHMKLSMDLRRGIVLSSRFCDRCDRVQSGLQHTTATLNVVFAELRKHAQQSDDVVMARRKQGKVFKPTTTEAPRGARLETESKQTVAMMRAAQDRRLALAAKVKAAQMSTGSTKAGSISNASGSPGR